MDPNANLQEQQQIITIPFSERTKEQSARLIELRKALRRWIEAGGFEPAWHSFPRASEYYFRWIGAVGCRIRDETPMAQITDVYNVIEIEPDSEFPAVIIGTYTTRAAAEAHQQARIAEWQKENPEDEYDDNPDFEVHVEPARVLRKYPTAEADRPVNG